MRRDPLGGWSRTTFGSTDVGPCLWCSLIAGMQHNGQSVAAPASCISQRGQKLPDDTGTTSSSGPAAMQDPHEKRAVIVKRKAFSPGPGRNKLGRARHTRGDAARFEST